VCVCVCVRACVHATQGRSEVAPAAYAHFTHMLKQLADGKLVLLIEVRYTCSSFPFINSSWHILNRCGSMSSFRSPPWSTWHCLNMLPAVDCWLVTDAHQQRLLLISRMSTNFGDTAFIAADLVSIFRRISDSRSCHTAMLYSRWRLFVSHRDQSTVWTPPLNCALEVFLRKYLLNYWITYLLT